MSQRFFLVNVIAVAAAAFPALAAAAVVDPLLVVVETAPGAAVDAVEVRQVISGELKAPVRAPRDPGALDTSDLLIVAVDSAEIRMSLRAGAAGVVSRAVPARGDRKARLQSIGWLAGNLARDQVGAIVAPLPAPDPVSVVSVEGEPPSRPEVPAPPPRPATDPPPLAENAAHDSAGASGGVVATQPSAATAGGAGSAWSLTLAGGPTALYQSGDRDLPVWPGVGIWYLELQRRASPDSLILGAALDVGPDMASGYKSGSIDFIGAAALVGGSRRFRWTFVEATAGLGLEAYQSVAVVNTQTTSETGISVESQGFSTLTLGLYLRGQATAGLTLSKSFDLLASVGGHLGSVGRRDAFLTSSLGVRFRFQ